MIIILDCNAICYMAKHSLKDLTWQEKKTGVLFGFFRQMLRLSEQFNTNKFVFCWDSRTSLRKEIYPSYKSTRKKEKTAEEKEEDEIIYAQFNLLKDKLLFSIGFKNIFEFEGYESDDIIAEVVQSYDDEFVIATADEDLYQLLSDKVKIWNLYKKKTYTKEDFEFEHHIEVKSWVLLKSLMGCGSDDVKGIEGIGEKSATKYIQGTGLNSKATQKIRNNYHIVKENLKLITLPFPDIPDTVLDFDETLSFDVFVDVCNKYGFNYYLKSSNLRKWTDRLDLK